MVMGQQIRFCFSVLVRRRIATTAAVAMLLSACVAGPNPGTGSALGIRLYVPSLAGARQTAAAWRGSRPADAAAMDFIARQPTAYWVGDWRGSVRSDVAGLIARSRASAAMPLLVAYNIPHRDCGQHSAGGATDGRAYQRWIRDFAAGLSGSRAIVVLEPDAVAGLDCLTGSQRAERIALLRDAVEVLKRAGATVYVDAGHARWHSPETMAARLRESGVARADGFALNVSNYIPNGPTIAYGERLSQLIGRKRFVIDTSRNGAGTAPAGAWCNVRGQALGALPTTNTGNALVAAFLWVKVPGESDGNCGGGPPAGEWWPEYALELVRRSRVFAG